MRLTKFTHSCVRIEKEGRALVIDPGVFSEAQEALSEANAILITHEHADHIDETAINKAMQADSRIKIVVPQSVAPLFAEYEERLTVAQSGQSFEMAGFRMRTFGGQHALIHPAIPIVENVGYLIDETVYHPGDSLIVPPVPVKFLLLPIQAPWSKFSEVADFLIGVRPTRACQIHDALLQDFAIKGLETNLARVVAPFGIEYQTLPPGSTVEV